MQKKFITLVILISLQMPHISTMDRKEKQSWLQWSLAQIENCFTTKPDIPINYKLSCILVGHTDWVAVTTFSSDNEHIVTLSEDGTARVWSENSSACLCILDGHGDKINSARFSYDGKYVITASDDCTACVWNAFTGRHVHTLAEHTGSVKSAKFSPDDKHIVTVSEDGTAKIWDAESSTCIHTSTNCAKWSIASKFNTDARHISRSSPDGTTYVWKDYEYFARRRLAFASALHARLGEHSPANVLPHHLVQKICSHVCFDKVLSKR